MLKNISNFGAVLNKVEQKTINGGRLSADSCNAPYFTADGICETGDYPHPVYGHCICCVG